MLSIADALEANEQQIRIENDADVAAAQEAGYEKSLVARLALKPGKARLFTYIYIYMYMICLDFNKLLNC